MNMNVIQGLVEQDGETPIVDLNASWESRWYSLGSNIHLCVNMFWDDPAVEGTLFLDYSGDPIDDGSQNVTGYSVKNTVAIDGTFSDVMILDSNLAISSFRLRFDHTSGAANLLSYIVRKGG